jgi:hypothetical protein
MYGSVRGAARKGRPYRDRGISFDCKLSKVVKEHPKYRLVLVLESRCEGVVCPFLGSRYKRFVLASHGRRMAFVFVTRSPVRSQLHRQHVPLD